MKQLLVIACLAFAVAGCNNEDKTKATTDAGETKTAAADLKLPIPLEQPYRGWQIGSTDNVVAAMNSLKAFVDEDYTALAATIGDSLYLDFDNYQAKLSHDSAVNMFKALRPQNKDLKVTMYDYVSVISADKKDEWVTLWYKQWWKNDKGVPDSMNVTDDIRMKDGKMIGLYEKTSRFQVKK